MGTNEMSEEQWMDAYPFVVAHIDNVTQAWSLDAYATMREALTGRRYRGESHVVFNSWADYYEWKRLRLASTLQPTPDAQTH